MEELTTHNSELITPEYTDENIRHLDDMEHIRVRSGMYIGRLGDGHTGADTDVLHVVQVTDVLVGVFRSYEF